MLSEKTVAVLSLLADGNNFEQMIESHPEMTGEGSRSGRRRETEVRGNPSAD